MSVQLHASQTLRIPSPEEIEDVRNALRKSLSSPRSKMDQACILYPCGHAINQHVAELRHGLYSPSSYYHCTLPDWNKEGLEFHPCTVCDTTVFSWIQDMQLRKIIDTFNSILKPLTQEEIQAASMRCLEALQCPGTDELLSTACTLSPCGHSVNEHTALSLYGHVTSDNPDSPLLYEKINGRHALLQIRHCKPSPCPECHTEVLTWTRNWKIRSVVNLFRTLFDPTLHDLPPLEEGPYTFFAHADNKLAFAHNPDNTNYYEWTAHNSPESLLRCFKLTTLGGQHYLSLQLRCPSLKMRLEEQGFEMKRVEPSHLALSEDQVVYECSSATQEEFTQLVDLIERFSVFEDPEELVLCKRIALLEEPTHFGSNQNLQQAIALVPAR